MVNDSLRTIIDRMPSSLSLSMIKTWHCLSDCKNIIRYFGTIREYERKQRQAERLMASEEQFCQTLRDFVIFNNKGGAEAAIDSYCGDAELKCLKKQEYFGADTEPILICCVKDDLKRIKKVYEHHMKLGIRKMIFLDNNSDDGTREWLLEQDVDVFYSEEEYRTGIKTSWIRKIQNEYGFNRWYLVVDSDELFSYVGMESHGIEELVNILESGGYKRCGSVMVDMYSDHELYVDREDDFEKEYRFFDVNSYVIASDGRGKMVRGGARKRHFQKEKNFSEALGKFPLYYAEPEDVWADHQPLPYIKNHGVPIISVLRHYKFMSGDYEKYREIISKGNYHGGSYTYKSYLESGKNTTLYYSESREYLSSKSLGCLPFLDQIEWGY